MKLSRLIEGVSIKSVFPEGADPEIGSIHYRSQDVRPGGLFIAIPGLRADGHDHIEDAVSRGASAVAAERPVRTGAAVVTVGNTRKALPLLAAKFHGEPSADLTMIGITGTNGKTTTTYILESILARSGFRCGVIGTINYRYGGKAFENPVTTPESADLQRILKEMREDGVTHVVMEVSSHAIDLHRVDACRFDVAVFTNISQDHLDYHKDMGAYWSCKKKLFTDLLAAPPKGGKAKAVINADNPAGRELLAELSVTKIGVGRSPEAPVRSESVRSDLSGIAGRIVTPGGAFSFASSLVGSHNLENILCAAGVGVALDLPLSSIREGIAAITRIPGRLEPVPDPAGRSVYVDYAHTPDALQNALTALRSLTRGRMICVFGCGGDRDRGKRPQMGEIAGNLSDLAVITSDNPRTEAPMEIIREILPGVLRTPRGSQEITGPLEGAEAGYRVEPDRRKAISAAVRAARPGDVVLIAGKGHETYQVIGREKLPFDDREEALKALREVLR